MEYFFVPCVKGLSDDFCSVKESEIQKKVHVNLSKDDFTNRGEQVCVLSDMYHL
jgi:hypothetical protein